MEDITNPKPLGKASTRAIRGVQLFAPGEHNGDTYSEADIDEMIAASKLVGFRPALKIGHTKDAPGDPAFGWVENLRKVGGKLVGDLVGLHESVYKAVKEGLYDRVSAEVFWGLKRGGRVFKRALKAVALLGAEVPAIPGLVPLHKMEFVATTDYGSVAACERAFSLGEERPSIELNRRTREHMRERGERSYETALEFVLEGDPDLTRRYAEEQAGRYAAPEKPDPSGSFSPVDVQVHRATLEWIERHPGTPYEQALIVALDARPDLRALYGAWRWNDER